MIARHHTPSRQALWPAIARPPLNPGFLDVSSLACAAVVKAMAAAFCGSEKAPFFLKKRTKKLLQSKTAAA
jgi:hypothetical protein